MSVRMRHTRAHTANRRSHHALKGRNLAVCQNCKAPKIQHQVCASCGQYAGRQVIDVAGKLEKKQKKTKRGVKAS